MIVLYYFCLLEDCLVLTSQNSDKTEENMTAILPRTIRAYWSKRRVVPPVLFRTNYYSIEILHGVTAIILTYDSNVSQIK